MTAERRAAPVTEVGQAGFVAQLAVAVIDPVPQEPARPGERELGPAIGMQVSDKVVHTSGARHCTYGRRRSRRGAGRPQWFAQSAREN